MVTAFITLNSGGWRKGWHRKSSRVSPSARRFTTADKGIADQHPFMDLSWTCQIILDAHGTYRHPAPAIRETSDADLLSPVFLPAPPGVCESRAETIVQPELSAATNATSSSAIWNYARCGRHRPSESDRAHKGRESRSPGEPPVHLWDLPRI